MIPPEVIIRERNLQELILKMIEGQILHCLLGPRRRRMIHRVTTPCGRGRTAISIGGRLPHQEINGSLNYNQIERCQKWQDTSDASAAAYCVKSIYENEGEAVKGSRSDAGYRW